MKMQGIWGKENLYTSCHTCGVLIEYGVLEASQNYKDICWGCDGPSLLMAMLVAKMRPNDWVENIGR